jgi:SWIM zinc finger
MANWSAQSIEQLAPDAAAFKTAQSTARPSKWANLGRNERLLWGECQGSGANPYQVRVDHIDIAYKCSCPSRKLPCKHTLALLLLMADGNVPAGTPPEFVDEWAGNRAKRAEAKQQREVQGASAEPDPQAKAKRIEKRENRIGAGLEQLQTWIADVVGQGLAAVRGQGAAVWSQMAARLVDAQAPGLARRVRELGDRAIASADWQSELLAGFARLQLLIEAYGKLAELPPDLAVEVRTRIGWTQDQDELRQREGVRDVWSVVARRQTEDENLRTQFTWLHGDATQRFALILEFAVGSQPLPATFIVGQAIDAELVFFDGCPQLRALEKARHAVQARPPTLPAGYDVAAMQSVYAQLVSANPWLDRHPFALGPVQPRLDREHLYLHDASGRRVPVTRSFRHHWNLFALAAGGSLTMFGEWDGAAFEPHTVQRAQDLFMVARLGDLAVLSKVA